MRSKHPIPGYTVHSKNIYSSVKCLIWLVDLVVLACSINDAHLIKVEKCSHLASAGIITNSTMVLLYTLYTFILNIGRQCLFEPLCCATRRFYHPTAEVATVIVASHRQLKVSDIGIGI
ncbi:hypothetical protein BGW37DRAFT_243783 [Umbelopsis sp. PMI_123]|nr:hypothetical protein BGW37DRAFT_243783 [Umbelopsis sp. PMI_123]